MIRSLARRGATVLVSAALVTGGVALGGGTAAAQDTPAPGSSADTGSMALLFYPGLAALTIGQATGSIGEDAPLEDCYTAWPSPDHPENRCPDTAVGFLGLILTSGSS